MNRLGATLANSKQYGDAIAIYERLFAAGHHFPRIYYNLGISQMQVSRRLKKAMGELWDTLNTRVTPW